MDVTVNIIAGTLPTGVVYNAQTYFNAIVARMTATISEGNIIFGQLGGVEPTAPLPGVGTTPGVWFGTSLTNSPIYQEWNADAAKYLPIPVTCGQYVNGQLLATDILCGAVTGSWKIVTPDKAGVIALLSDLPQALQTQTPSLGTITPNWDIRSAIYVVMSGDLTFNAPSGADDGQIMDYFLENATGANHTVNWGSSIKWPGGTAPTPSVGVSGQRVIDHYRIQFQGGTFFGKAVAQNYQIAVGAQTIVPTVVSITAEGNDIFIQFSANLIGGTIATAGFTVMVNGSTATINAVVADGTFCAVLLATALHAADTVTVHYTGTDLRSIQENPVASFGPSHVNLANVGTPSAPGGGGGLFNHYLS